MNNARQALEEELERSVRRERYLNQAKDELRNGFVSEAVVDLLSVVRLLSESETRVLRLHAECVGMLEQAAKILQLDASLRPVVVQLPTDPIQPGCEMSTGHLDAGAPAIHAEFMATKKASGENIPEGFRNTEAVKLRLDPETANRLRSFAFEHGWSLSQTVAEAFKALERELEADEAHNVAVMSGEGLRAVANESDGS